MVVHACSSSTGEEEVEGSFQSHLQLPSYFEVSLPYMSKLLPQQQQQQQWNGEKFASTSRNQQNQ